MAKINHVLAEYSQAIKDNGMPEFPDLPPKTVVGRFLKLFRSIDDTRVKGMISYPLDEILLVAFIAVLGGSSTWVEIQGFAESHIKWLRKFITLKNGVPSHDTFRRVFSLIDSAQMQKATVDFLIEHIDKIRELQDDKEDENYRLICVDGKEERATGRKYSVPDEKVSNLQTLHVFDMSGSICLASEPINEKTNEIPVAQSILSTMDLKKAIVTFDALHTQRKTVEIIVERKGDYIGGLKGNHTDLLHDKGLRIQKRRRFWMVRT